LVIYQEQMIHLLNKSLTNPVRKQSIRNSIKEMNVTSHLEI